MSIRHGIFRCSRFLTSNLGFVRWPMRALASGYGSRLASMKLGIFCMGGPYKRYKSPSPYPRISAICVFPVVCVEIFLRIIVGGHTPYSVPHTHTPWWKFYPYPHNKCLFLFLRLMYTQEVHYGLPMPDKDSASIRDPSFQADPDPNCGVKISQISSWCNPGSVANVTTPNWGELEL